MFLWGARKEFVHVRDNVAKPGQDAYKWLIAFARGAGYTLNLNSALILLLASRLLLTRLRETVLHRILPLDKSFPAAHIAVGYAILVGVCIHVPFHFAWLIAYDEWDPFTWWSFTMSVVLGVPLLIVFIYMFITARPAYRRNHFRRFYVSHMICAALFCLLVLLHGMFRKKPETYKYITAFIVIYTADRLLRRRKEGTVYLELLINQSKIMAGRVLKMQLVKPFNYVAGQYAEIRVPSISSEWHPFTIASAPHEKNMTFFIKAAGDWTTQLYEIFERNEENPTIEWLPMDVRGPYGAPAQHIGNYERVVLISGGIGATPFAAIAKHVHHYCISPVDTSVLQRKQTDKSMISRDYSFGTADIDILKLYKADSDDLNDDRGILKRTRTEHLTNMINLKGFEQQNTKEDDEQVPTREERSSKGKSASSVPDTIVLSQSSKMSFTQRALRSSLSQVNVEVEDGGYPQILQQIRQNRQKSAIGVSSTINRSVLSDQAQRETSQRSQKYSVVLDMDRGEGSEKKSDQIAEQPIMNEGEIDTERELEAGEPENGLFTMGDLRKNISPELIQVRQLRFRLFSFLHSTRVTILLLFSILGRMLIGGIISIFELQESQFASVGTFERSRWLVAFANVLAIIFTTVMFVTIAMEISYMKLRFFNSLARCIDLFLMLPISILSCILGVRAWAGFGLSPVLPFFHYVAFLPLLFLLLSIRLYRSVTSRTIFEIHEPLPRLYRAPMIPDVDFLWTTPHHEDDQWLREELEPLANGCDLRLHRYVTRAKSTELDSDDSDSFMVSHPGRPQWDPFFRNIAARSYNHSQIGVFFCGPRRMGADVVRAMRHAETLSNLKGAYLRTSGNVKLILDFKIDDSMDLQKIREYGSNIRFIFREENF